VTKAEWTIKKYSISPEEYSQFAKTPKIRSISYQQLTQNHPHTVRL
jgi:hypothetical protein